MLIRTALCVSLLMPLCASAADAAATTNNEDLHSLSDRVRQLEQRQQTPQPAAASNTFNPDIAMILAGTYGNLQRDPTIPATGFAMSPNNNGYTRGFSLNESELGVSANIDPQFRGVATLSLSPAGGVSVENGFVQTTTLGSGFNLKFGRFFSGLGYLNEQHAHTWDFTDQPLVYRVFWDNQLADDGIQFKWLAPTDTFIEIGGELGNGRGYPGTTPQKNGAAADVLFAHVGDDIGVSSSWRAGVSLHQTKQSNWISTGVPDLLGTVGGATDSFSGTARTSGVDFIWEYAPDGDATVSNFKLLGEYFRRTQNGLLTYNNATTDTYTVTQSGWYVQGVYQFMPAWRAGMRYDRLNSGNAQVGAELATSVISNYRYTPKRSTLMLDYSPSEFARIRLQLARDNSRQGLPDNQMFVQYIMSLGAHGAHQF
jgi:hypothetical protein